MQAWHDTNKRRAFTLLELLASTAVLALLVLLMAQVFSHVSQSWLAGRDAVQNRRNFRAIADFIGDELVQALLPIENQASSSAGNLQFILNPPALRLPTNYCASDALFWQAPLATETTFGDIAIIGYFVKWHGGTPYLCRLFINPSITDADGVVASNPDYLIYDATDPNAWISTDLLQRLVRPTDKVNGYPGLFAENVLGFWVRCFDSDGTELPKTYDSRAGVDVSGNSSPGTAVTPTLPAVVEVSLAIVGEGRAAHLTRAQTAVQALTSDPTIKNAEGFLARLRSDAEGTPILSPLVPVVSVFTKRVQLQNSR